MTRPLSPHQAALIAANAYVMRTYTDMASATETLPGSVTNVFDVAHGTRLAGSTGMVVDARSGLGYIARGKGTRQHECLIAVRGTATFFDVLSDLRFAGMNGPNGYFVDIGFWRAAESILPQIRDQLRQLRPQSLHIVGHSLGGAMATLIAAALSTGSSAYQTRLYTFGAPRSGVVPEAQYLTARLGAENIFRVYHDTDPVPMVPVFPYAHVPFDNNAYRLKGNGSLISFDAHRMRGYEHSVGACTWSSLPVIKPSLDSFEAASAWLKKTARSSDSWVIMGSSYALSLLLSALHWILKEAGMVTGLILYGGATIVDGLARLLYTGALQAVHVAEAVQHMLAAAMRIMGHTVAAGTRVTTQFISQVLRTLYQYIMAAARHALDVMDPTREN